MLDSINLSYSLNCRHGIMTKDSRSCLGQSPKVNVYIDKSEIDSKIEYCLFDQYFH